MKTLSYCVLGFSLMISTVCLGQIDIYQSDAYSVEEMCAREAEQNTTMEYTDAYESCIKKNSENPMYQSEGRGVDAQHPEKNDSDDTAGQADIYSQNQGDQESPPDQENYN